MPLRTSSPQKTKAVEIPDAWLMGCCQALERQGLGPREALEEAVRQWVEQERLERLRGQND